MGTLYVNEDIPHRTTNSGTWVEQGEYRMLKRLPRNRYLIVLKQFNKERQLTIVRKEECL